jgi:hypothetical protein
MITQEALRVLHQKLNFIGTVDRQYDSSFAKTGAKPQNTPGLDFFNTGVELTFPTQLAEGLADASPDSLAEIEISPAGLGLHWPRLDADLYVPALLQGVFGSKRWMARQLGAEGGRSRTAAKIAASRENGRKGGRPRKPMAAGA